MQQDRIRVILCLQSRLIIAFETGCQRAFQIVTKQSLCVVIAKAKPEAIHEKLWIASGFAFDDMRNNLKCPIITPLFILFRQTDGVASCSCRNTVIYQAVHNSRFPGKTQ
jgi:hypothetical protein